MLKVWSNGRFCNVKHRVQCKEASIRVSIASFFLGPKEAAVEAPPELVDSENPRQFVPFTYEDYRKDFRSICMLVKPSNLYAPIHDLLACHVYPQPLYVSSSSPNCDDL